MWQLWRSITFWPTLIVLDDMASFSMALGSFFGDYSFRGGNYGMYCHVPIDVYYYFYFHIYILSNIKGKYCDGLSGSWLFKRMYLRDEKS